MFFSSRASPPAAPCTHARRLGPTTSSSATSRRGPSHAVRTEPRRRSRLRRNSRTCTCSRPSANAARASAASSARGCPARWSGSRPERRALVISDLGSLCRSIVDLGSVVPCSAGTRAASVALDLRLGTATSEGQAVAKASMALSAWERARIAGGTRSGIARVRARGAPIGAPAVADALALRDRVFAMRAANMTLQAIADTLTRRWRPDSAARHPAAAVERAELPGVPAPAQSRLMWPSAGRRNVVVVRFGRGPSAERGCRHCVTNVSHLSQNVGYACRNMPHPRD
jgi:hypothetical protein